MSQTSVCMISCDVFVSRLPVGSSARSTLGSIDQRSRDSHPLLLPARKLAWEVALSITQTNEPECRTRSLKSRPRPSGPRSRIDQWQANIFYSAGAGKQIERLKYETDTLAPYPCEVGIP